MTKNIMKMKGGIFRSFTAAFFAGGCNVILIFFPLPKLVNLVLTYLVIVLLELRIAFPFQNISTYAKALGVLYLLSFGIGGGMKWIYDNFQWAYKYGRNIIWLLGGVYFIALCIGKICVLVKVERMEKAKLRRVTCEVNGKILECTALLDTGNSLFDPVSMKPVSILERSELKKYSIYIKKEQYRVVPYHSLGTKQGVLEAFVADKVVITPMEDEAKSNCIERENVIVGIYEGKLSQDERYQMILHPDL